MRSEANAISNTSWPAELRAALTIFIHVDAPDLEHPIDPQPVGLDYTATGLRRLIALLADLDVSATTAWTARALASFPQLERSARDQGHELALSKVTPGSGVCDVKLLTHISDVAPSGSMESLPMQGISPKSSIDATGSLEEPLAWTVTGVSGDVPISTMYRGQPGPAIIPVSPYWIDTTWLLPDRPLPPSSMLEAWSLSLNEVRAEGSLMTIVLHPHVSGRPGFAGLVQHFLDEAIDSGVVWIANAAQVAEWWHRLEQEAPRT